jgi:translocator protein
MGTIMSRINIVDWKLFIMCIVACLGLGTISGLLTANSVDVYKTINLPDLAPPSILFPIVWTILYILMGLSLYLVLLKRDSEDIRLPVAIFVSQFILNFIWAPIFFTYAEYLLSFIIIVIMWVLVLAMIITFRRINPVAGYMQIPYLLWLIVAGYLSWNVYVLN